MSSFSPPKVEGLNRALGGSDNGSNRKHEGAGGREAGHSCVVGSLVRRAVGPRTFGHYMYMTCNALLALPRLDVSSEGSERCFDEQAGLPFVVFRLWLQSATPDFNTAHAPVYDSTATRGQHNGDIYRSCSKRILGA